MMRVRCPVVTPSGCEGCGHVFDATPAAAGEVDEGYVECPVCGLAFEPEPTLDTNTRERNGMMTANQAEAEAAARLRAMLQAASDEMIADAERWERLACGQDTEEAEESGRLAGVVEGLEAALRTVGDGDPAPPRVRVVYVVRPFDAMQDVAAFADEDDAVRFHDTFDAGDVGDIERVTVCDAAIAAEMVAQREAADEDDEGTPLIDLQRSRRRRREDEDEGTSCHDDCQHPDLDHATSGEPCRGSDGLPLIDWEKLSDVSDVILPVPFRDTDREGNPGEGERLDRIAHGSRIVDSAGNRYLLMGAGSMQGTVVLRDANGRTFQNEADERFKLG